MSRPERVGFSPRTFSRSRRRLISIYRFGRGGIPPRSDLGVLGAARFRALRIHHASKAVRSLLPRSCDSLRKGWDSNPRETFIPNALARRRFRPLSHPSLMLSCWESAGQAHERLSFLGGIWFILKTLWKPPVYQPLADTTPNAGGRCAAFIPRRLVSLSDYISVVTRPALAGPTQPPLRSGHAMVINYCTPLLRQ